MQDITLPPWERLLWSGRTWVLPGIRPSRYALTDFRLLIRSTREVSGAPPACDELALQDIVEIDLSRSRLERALGLSTLRVVSRLAGRPPLVLRAIRRGSQLAALLELMAGLPQSRFEPDAVAAALAWEPRTRPRLGGGAAAALAAAAVVLTALLAAVRGPSAAGAYAPDDPIYRDGEKRGEGEIVRFMEADVMPWARQALGPLAGGADRITCETCHGHDARARRFAMPAVAALPETHVTQAGWDRYGGGMDAQMRNAIYGYLAAPDKQGRAAYMREVVLPGMARLLRRPPYDFTRTYAYNRARMAFGCYHCHRVR
ncbi:MAG: PH domain-containing protein [Acidobacteria bacterium]|nr:PH domain-containing protein [Acidobacteriota bacterium]